MRAPGRLSPTPTWSFYREALRLQAEGADDETIAAVLDLTVEAVPALLLLAERKQARAEDPEPPAR